MGQVIHSLSPHQRISRVFPQVIMFLGILSFTLHAVSAAGGVVINRGSLFASLVIHQVGSNIVGGGNVHTATFVWNLYANNDVVVPVGGGDVSSRNVTVTLPEYPGSAQSISLYWLCFKSKYLLLFDRYNGYK
ncbi:fimbrial protein [Providencia stuartii]|nr:fimbrial protein [Providencia stuartii]MDN0019476.1 fimbrial protein [Providencia stuartii]UQZ13962.1 fimbrial protein [Providencia stuartii]